MTAPADMTDHELSEAVAVEVMGWGWTPPGKGISTGVYWPWHSPKGHGFSGVRAYATDIAAAMEVFEKAGDPDHPIEPTGEPSSDLRYHRDDSSQPMWSAAFMLTDLEGETFLHVEVLNKSAPRAICEAALLWSRSRTDA